jgi:hypothetical protein
MLSSTPSLLALALGCTLLAATAPAASFSFTGSFTQDDDSRLFQFNLAAPSTVTLRTYGYAGGVNSANQIIAAGGFDPLLTLFVGTGPTAFQLSTNNDGGCSSVGTDPNTNTCWDAYLQIVNLTAGSYTLVLTQNDNFPGGLLADAFSRFGEGNFTAGAFGGFPGPFVDANPAQRTGFWAVDILGVSSAVDTASAAIPEPSSLVLLGGGALLLLARRRR